MTVTARAWLPPGAALPQLGHGAVAAMIDGWSQDWFGAAPLAVSGAIRPIGEGYRPLRGGERVECAPGIAIGLSTQGAAALGARALAVSGQSASRTPEDVALLERIGGDCLDDLKSRTRAVLAVGDAAPAPVSHALEVTSPTRDLLLTIELSAERFAAFVCSRLPERPARAPLPAMHASVAHIAVPVRAAIGGCKVTAAELADIAPGDVLMLDRNIEQAVPLAIGEPPALHGACSVGEREGALTLTITQPPGE